MARLPWASPEVAYAADINDLAVALWSLDETNRDAWGWPSTETTEPTVAPKDRVPPSEVKPPANAPPITPSAFDTLVRKKGTTLQ